jgi:RecA/RadA recombinase
MESKRRNLIRSGAIDIVSRLRATKRLKAKCLEWDFTRLMSQALRKFTTKLYSINQLREKIE